MNYEVCGAPKVWGSGVGVFTFAGLCSQLAVGRSVTSLCLEIAQKHPVGRVMGLQRTASASFQVQPLPSDPYCICWFSVTAWYVWYNAEVYILIPLRELTKFSN